MNREAAEPIGEPSRVSGRVYEPGAQATASTRRPRNPPQLARNVMPPSTGVPESPVIRGIVPRPGGTVLRLPYVKAARHPTLKSTEVIDVFTVKGHGPAGPGRRHRVRRSGRRPAEAQAARQGAAR